MAAPKIFPLYEQHAGEWDEEFRRVSGRFADRMQCRKGCSMCCSQMFSISPLEAARIGQAGAAMPGRQRQRLHAAAVAYNPPCTRIPCH